MLRYPNTLYKTFLLVETPSASSRGSHFTYFNTWPSHFYALVMVFCQHLNAQKCTNSVGRRGCVDLAGELTALSIVGLRTPAVSPTGLVLRSFGPRLSTFGPAPLCTCLRTLVNWKWPGCLDVLEPPLSTDGFYVSFGDFWSSSWLRNRCLPFIKELISSGTYEQERLWQRGFMSNRLHTNITALTTCLLLLSMQPIATVCNASLSVIGSSLSDTGWHVRVYLAGTVSQ